MGELISLDGNPRSASAVRFGRTTQNTSFELIAWEWGPKPIQEFQQIFKNGPPPPEMGAYARTLLTRILKVIRSLS